MKRMIKAVSEWVKSCGHKDEGMATAEYAVGTVAVISFGSLVLKILSDPQFRDMIWRFLKWLFEWIMGLVTG